MPKGSGAGRGPPASRVAEGPRAALKGGGVGMRGWVWSGHWGRGRGESERSPSRRARRPPASGCAALGGRSPPPWRLRVASCKFETMVDDPAGDTATGRPRARRNISASRPPAEPGPWNRSCRTTVALGSRVSWGERLAYCPRPRSRATDQLAARVGSPARGSPAGCRARALPGVMIAPALGQLVCVRADLDYPRECAVCKATITRRVEPREFIGSMLSFELCTAYFCGGLLL